MLKKGETKENLLSLLKKTNYIELHEVNSLLKYHRVSRQINLLTHNIKGN